MCKYTINKSTFEIISSLIFNRIVTFVPLIQSGRIPNLNNIRKVLFWDTDFNQLDWIQDKSSIIKRIFEHGNENEIQEIISFYGRPTIKRILRLAKNNFLPAFNENVKKYL